MWSSPTIVDGIVFVGSNDGNLYAVDAATGEEHWRFETGDKIRSSPTVVDGTVYIGSTTVKEEDGEVTGVHGDLYALDSGVSESSSGSRISLGTLGHTVASSGPQDITITDPEDTDDSTDNDDVDETNGDNSGSDDSDDDDSFASGSADNGTEPDAADEEGPGMGITTTVTSIGGLLYLVRNRLASDED